MKSDTISTHQLGVIAGILLFTLKMSSLPSLIYKYNASGAIVSTFVVIVLNILFVWLVVWFKQKYKNATIYDIFKQKMGIFLTKLLFFIFFLFFFFKILLMISDGYTFIKDVADEDFPIYNLFICFLPIISTMAYSGLRNIGRTAEFFFPFIILSLVMAIAFSIIPNKLWSFGSLTINGASGFFNSIFRLSFWTGDLFAIIIFLDKIEVKKGKLSQIFVPFGIMSALLFVIFVIYFVLYQETSIFHVNVLYDVVQYAIGTSKGWHMDFFAMVVFMINMFIQGAILMYCANECLKKLLNYNQGKISIVFINLALIFVDFLYLTDYLKYVSFAENILCYFSAITIVLVPILILILILTKKETKNEKV